MSLNCGTIASRLLAYPAIASADAANVTGLLTWIVDAIMDARGQIARAGGGVFEEPLGAVLRAPSTTPVTVAAATPTALTGITGANVPNDLCTLRIPGMSCDATVKALASTTASIAPGYDGIASGSTTVTAQVWHDAWKISTGSNVNDAGTRIRVAGLPLMRVSGREQAEATCGTDARIASIGAGRRLIALSNGLPQVWWLEHYGAATFILVYPMPGYAMAIESRVQLGVTAVTEDTVLASTETFGLSDDMLRDVLRPLAIEAFRNSPFMANVTIGEEIALQVKRANEILDGVRPKPPGPLPWGMNRAWSRGLRDY